MANRVHLYMLAVLEMCFGRGVRSLLPSELLTADGARCVVAKARSMSDGELAAAGIVVGSDDVTVLREIATWESRLSNG